MTQMWTKSYSEKKEHRFLQLVWRVVNLFILPCMPKKLKILTLRAFGAKIERSIVVKPGAKIFAPWNLEVKSPWAVIGPGAEIYNKAKVTLGGGVVVSQDAYLCTASHDVNSPAMTLVTKPIIVEDNAWIASKAVILPGVTIGKAAVVGCAAVVTRDVAPWSVVAGNPAKFIKKRELK